MTQKSAHYTMNPLSHKDFTTRMVQTFIAGLLDAQLRTDAETIRNARIVSETLVTAAEVDALADLARLCELFVDAKIGDVERELAALKVGGVGG